MNHHHLPPSFPNNSFFSSSPSFNPNPNPNFNSAFILSPPPPPQFNTSQPQSQCQSQSRNTSLPDLPTSLSLLTDLLDLSSSTFLSLSSLISQQPLSVSSDGFSRCPSNPNHLLPPESLFVHSLHCPAPITEDVRSLLDALHYPKTLKSERQLIEQNKFVHPLSDPQAELCFSLDDYVDVGSNFFYQDCPGVVSSLNDDGVKRMFSLPGVLSVECANFACGVDGETNSVAKGFVRLLPSELWAVKCEIEQWSDFPNAYSYSILRVLLCLEMAKEHDLLTWVIANSPRFGVIIDSPMRDHIFVLFRLCVKAILRETYRSYDSLLKENLEKTGGHLNGKTMSCSCPALNEVLSWLTTQLAVLYGEANAKLFTIGMVKHLLLNVASKSLLYPLGQYMDRAQDNEQRSVISGGYVVGDQSPRRVGENEGDSVASGGIVSRAVFVYQVAAAIAALHERSSLEEMIKALRSPLSMPAYQRVAEHDYLSKRAQEERQKRQNYRPLIEHDGLPLQRSHDKDATGRNKTREELIAEERDYKRRRMSYRGKKSKRNTKEVMRDIIGEHMEAIRQAGGIGCFDKGVEDGSVRTSKLPAEEYAQNMEFNRITSYEYESSKVQHNFYNKHLNSGHSSKTTEPIAFENRRCDHRMQDSYEPAEHARDRKVSSQYRHRGDSYHRSPGRERHRGRFRDQRSERRKETEEGDSYPQIPSRERNYGQWRAQKSDRTETEADDRYPKSPSREKKSRQSRHRKSHRSLETEEDDSYLRSPSTERDGQSRDKRTAWRNETEEEIYSSRSTSKHHGNWSSSRTSGFHSGRKDKQRFEDSDGGRRKRYRNDRLDSVTDSGFGDRYAPSRSPET